MTTPQVATLVALLSLLCWAATLGALAIMVLRRIRPDRFEPLAAALAQVALPAAAVVAAITTAGSLYFSEVADFTPCELCWFQRICVYPLTITLAVAALRRDTGVWRYVVGPAGVGALIAAYHTQLQAFPDQATFCPSQVPCTTRYVWEFGFVSLPFMALAAFAAILVAVMVAARVHPSSSSPAGPAADQSVEGS